MQGVYSPDPLTYEFQTRLSRTADGKGLRIVGTNALYAYEAASGVFVDPDIVALFERIQAKSA